MAIPFERPVTLTRTSAGSYVRGVWVDGTESTVNVMATILPERNVQVLAQIGGTNLDGVYTIRSESTIQAADEDTGAVGDKFTIDGKTYEVTTLSVYRDVKPHYKGWATLEDDKES